MFEIFNQFNLPTFLFSLLVFIFLSSLWNFIKALILKRRSGERLQRSTGKLKTNLRKIKAMDQQIEDLLKQQKPPVE